MNEKGGQRRYVRLSLFDDFQTLAILNFSQIIYTRRKIERKKKQKEKLYPSRIFSSPLVGKRIIPFNFRQENLVGKLNLKRDKTGI